MNRKLFTVLSVLSMALFTVQATAGTITTTIASDDNIISGQSGFEDIVQDSTGAIRTKRSPNRAGFIKFDLSQYAGYIEVTESATLSLTVYDADTTSADSYVVGIYGLDAGYTPTGGKLGTDWNETAITWNNAPGWDGSPGAGMTQIGVNFTVIGDTDDGRTYEFSIATLSSFLQSDNTATFAIFVASQVGGNWLDWYSSETGSATTAPLLTYTVPEPSTLLLAGLGLLGSLGFRRRRCRRR